MTDDGSTLSSVATALSMSSLADSRRRPRSAAGTSENVTTACSAGGMGGGGAGGGDGGGPGGGDGGGGVGGGDGGEPGGGDGGGVAGGVAGGGVGGGGVGGGAYGSGGMLGGGKSGGPVASVTPSVSARRKAAPTVIPMPHFTFSVQQGRGFASNRSCSAFLR